MRLCSSGDGLLLLSRSKVFSVDSVQLSLEAFSQRKVSFARDVRCKMSSDASSSSSSGNVVLYPSKSPLISEFWRDIYEKDARKYWDLFYKRNSNKFFKDRHYLDKEWGKYFEGMDLDAGLAVSYAERAGSSQEKRIILEIGCGTGNTVYPLLSQYPDVFVYACDFSERAVDLVKGNADYDEKRVKAFVCDVTKDPLSDEVPKQSVHVITLVFVLSAITPEKMSGVLSNLKAIIKPGGYILLRDYAVGDLAQKRLSIKDQKISENFYVRGDGTRAYYFSEDVLTALFVEQGFESRELTTYCRQFENRSRKIVMDRRWIQAVFYLPEQGEQAAQNNVNDIPVSDGSISEATVHVTPLCGDLKTRESESENRNLVCNDVSVEVMERDNCSTESEIELGVADFSALELFGGAPAPEPMEVTIGNLTVHAMCIPRENQHTFAATGFMLWESASAFAELLAANPAITRGKSVLELGCGSVGLCSLISSLTAVRVVATDGDAGTLKLLQDNRELNRPTFPVDSICCMELEWGSKAQINAVREANGGAGFQLIFGTDVTYVQEAVPLLFETAMELMAEPSGTDGYDPLLLLCYRVRRVGVSDILAAASNAGFNVAGLWTADQDPLSSSGGHGGGNDERRECLGIESLFQHGLDSFCSAYSGLQILCLHPAKKSKE